MPTARSVVRPPRTIRLFLAIVTVIGIVLVVGSISDHGLGSGSGVVGVICLVGGVTGVFARGECDEDGVMYRNGRRYRVDRASISAVRVELRGWSGTFPTLVVYRSSGRPVVMRAVADFRGRKGQARQDALAANWREILGLPAADEPQSPSSAA